MVWVGGFGSPPILLQKEFIMAMSKYAKLKNKLAHEGASNPAALAAWIGRKKLGKAEFQRRAAAGRRGAK
jgi:hypothetical protein